MRRFFINGELEEEVIFTGGDARHMLYALRYRKGQEILVADKNGQAACMELVEFTSDRVRAILKERLPKTPDAPVRVTLLQCLPKGGKMDFIIQKAAELGAAAVLPVASRRCVVRYDDLKCEARQQKWQKIADEAAKQCGRQRRVTVLPVCDLARALEKAQDSAARFMLYETPGQRPFKEVLQQAKAKDYELLVGPEGGFTAEEAALGKAFGFQTVGVGPRILRTETAAIAALSIVLYEKGDLGGT